MFKQAATYNNTTDLQEYSETVTAYITKCIDDVTVTKSITVRANQKPWLTGEVYRLLKARNAAFRAGDEEGLKTARANLSRGIREAKRQYSRRIAHRFSDSRDTRSLWQGIQTITDYKPPPQTCDSTLLNELNASAFNTIIPQQLIHKLVQLGLNTSLCNWLLDFLTGRPQAVRVGSNTSSTITLNTGAPQGCVLSPLLFTLLTHDCTPSHNSNLFIKFADDTTVVGLISNRDETNYRSEVSRLAG